MFLSYVKEGKGGNVMLVAGLKVCCEGRSQCIETINRELW